MTIDFYQMVIKIVNKGFWSHWNPLLHTQPVSIINDLSLSHNNSVVIQSTNDHCVPAGYQISNVLTYRTLRPPSLLLWILNLTFSRISLSSKILLSPGRTTLWNSYSIEKKNTHTHIMHITHICICTYIIYTHKLYTCIHIVCIPLNVYMCTYLYTHTYMCMNCVCICICVYICNILKK